MISVPSNFVDEMIEHAVQENPNECCGILAGKDGLISALYRVRNSTPSPYRYVICLLYTSPSPRDATLSRMPSSA